MIFSHKLYLEFCFNHCYTSTAVSQAIKAITYHGGMTHTEGAAQCACRSLLDESCGLPEDAECLDVVVITDGQFNDSYLHEIQCLYDQSLNTYVMCIGSVSNDELLQCIQKSNNKLGIFKFDSYNEVMQTFRDVLEMLKNPIAPYKCLNNCGILRKKKK